MLRNSLLALSRQLSSSAVQAASAKWTSLQPLTSAAARWYSTATSQQFKNLLYSSNPKSLEFKRPQWEPAPGVEESVVKRSLLRLFGFYSKEATIMRAAQGLYDGITEAVDDKRLAEALALPDDFQHLHSLLCLHIWLLLVRLRSEGKAGKQLAQQLYDNFQDDVEKRARAAGVKVRLHKQLVELEKQFYGSSFAYDRALKGEGGEDLAAVLHRNVYQRAEAGREAAAVLARYVKRELACLTMTDTAALFQGNIRLSALRLLPALQTEGGGPVAEGAGPVAEGAGPAAAACPPPPPPQQQEGAEGGGGAAATAPVS